MANGVGMRLGTSGFCRDRRRVISLTGVTSAPVRRFKVFLTNHPGSARHASHMAAFIRLLAAQHATALVRLMDRGAAHAHQL